MTQILTPSELKYLLIDSLKLYSQDAIYISGRNPYEFSVNKKRRFIFLHNVHDSGSGRPNEDESRIQFQSTENFEEAQKSGEPVLFLGYSMEHRVFTAWDPRIQTERINQKSTVSVYSRFSVIKKASEVGLSLYVDNNGQHVISFRPEHLGLYLENFDQMHQSDEDTLLQLTQRSDEAEQVDEGSTSEGLEVDIKNQKFTVNHTVLKRDGKFRKIITSIYSHRCAFCGIQLELVEAAHIIPHSHTNGTDNPENGVCLCALHHKAYDDGLIYFDLDYNIKINEGKNEYLTKMGRDGGAQKFMKLQFDKVSLPESSAFHPSKENIALANQIRGISE